MNLSQLKPYTKELSLLIVEDEQITRSIVATIFRRVFKFVKEASTKPQESEITPTVATSAQEIDHSNYYEQILKEDIAELVDLVDEIENFSLLTFQGTTVYGEYIDQLVGSFQKFGTILYRYPIFNALAGAIFKLASGISEQKETFLNKQEFVIPFLENLILVLGKYVDSVWKKPSKNPHFYDASMINDIDTFLAILQGDDSSGANNTEDLLEFF